jgi:hypothetical protein
MGGLDSNPWGASYQLRRAVEVANDRYSREGLYQPLPEIKKLRAQAYSEINDPAKASLAMCEAIQAYIDADQLDEASTILAQLPAESTRDLTLLRYIVDLRRQAARSDAAPNLKQLRQLNQPNSDIALDFIERQEFKILGDFVAKQPAGVDKSSLSAAMDAYRLALKDHLPLVSIRDLLRWRAVESTLSSSIGSLATQESPSYFTGQSSATLTLALPGVTVARSVSVSPEAVVGARTVQTLGIDNIIRWRQYIFYDGSRLHVPMEFGPLIQKLEAASIRLLSYHSGVTFIAPSPQPYSPPEEPSNAQRQEDLRDVVKNANKVVDGVREPLFGNLTGAEAKKYKEIVFRVTDKDSLSRAYGYVEHGTPVVEIDEGYFRQISMMAEAQLIEQAQGKLVLIPYIRYVVLSWREKATFIKDPTRFTNFDFDTILDKPDGARAWSKMITNAMAFVVAHEVGHHVLGHYDKPRPTDADKLRQMETDADEWAIHRLEHATPHFTPLSGVLPLIFDYYITASPIEKESNSTHPADLRRISRMFEAMKAALPDYRDEINLEGKKLGFTYRDFEKYIANQLDDYEEQIEHDAPPVGELPPVGKQSGNESDMGQGH